MPQFNVLQLSCNMCTHDGQVRFWSLHSSSSSNMGKCPSKCCHQQTVTENESLLRTSARADNTSSEVYQLFLTTLPQRYQLFLTTLPQRYQLFLPTVLQTEAGWVQIMHSIVQMVSILINQQQMRNVRQLLIWLVHQTHWHLLRKRALKTMASRNQNIIC